MKIFCIAFISAVVVVFVSGCSTSKNNSTTITATNTSSEMLRHGVLGMLDSLKDDSINVIHISDKSHSIKLKCTKKVPNFGYNMESGTFPPTFLNYVGPKVSVANFDLIFHISNNKCIVKIKNVHYNIHYLSRNLPKAGPSKNVVSDDKKLHKKNTTPQLSKDVLSIIREKLLVSSTKTDDSN